MRWPAQLPKGNVYPHRVSTLDVLPTCLEAAGAEIPAGLDGLSMLQAVRKGKPAPSSNKPMFWRFQDHEEQYAVRDGDWKLVKTRNHGGYRPTCQVLMGPPIGDKPQLFDLKNDPSEQLDVADKHPEVVERLQALYRHWEEEMRHSGGDEQARVGGPALEATIYCSNLR
jgi:arylsulfatase A-like enzyme